MTLTELRYIVMLAKERHFGKAAARCFVSQPTLSVAVKKLEDELGVILFERHKGKLVVTDMGHAMVAQAQVVLDQVNVFKELALQGKDQLNSALKIGAIYTIGPYLFPHLMPQMRQAAPEMPLYIEENYTAVLTRKLKECELDAIIVVQPFNEPDMVTQNLYDEPFVVLLPKGHALAEQEKIDPDLLAQEDLLMLGPGHCFREQVLEASPALKNMMDPSSAAQKQQAKVITEGSSLETIRYMVASGIGISVLPLSAVVGQHQQNELIEVRPFSSPEPFRTVALAWRSSFPRPQAIDILSQSAKQCDILSAHSNRQETVSDA